MVAYSYKSPAYNSPSTKSEQSSSRGKNRIYQAFEKTIELDELSIPATESPNSANLENTMSLQYPIIKINDYMLSKNEIISMEIDCHEFIPKISLKCMFIHRTILSKEMPKDGDIISIAIRNKSDTLKPIRNDYVITSVVVGSNTTQAEAPIIMTFYGVLFLPYSLSSENNLSFEGTSINTIKEIAKKTGLGFATNEDDTDDNQPWINTKDTAIKFIQKITERSWRDEKSFYDIWIDVYYNLNFININKILLSAEDEVDPGAWLNNIDKEHTFGNNLDQNKTIEAPKVFSNYDNFRTSSFYIISWRPINRSTIITYEVGSKMECNLFEHNKNVYANNDSKKYWSFLMDPVYDEEKTSKYILLRGRAHQREDMRGEDQARANYSYPEIYVKKPWMGVQYTISEYEKNTNRRDGNHHKNYHRAKIQNVINNKELEKLNVEIEVNGINLNFIKGEKAPVVLISKDNLENLIINPNSGNQDRLEQFYSGWFYIKGFNIRYTKANDDSIMSNFTQKFTLTRREWPPPIAVDGLPKNENN
jgi:hypothetical protein